MEKIVNQGEATQKVLNDMNELIQTVRQFVTVLTS
jgi:hypothetical protein